MQLTKKLRQKQEDRTKRLKVLSIMKEITEPPVNPSKEVDQVMSQIAEFLEQNF